MPLQVAPLEPQGSSNGFGSLVISNPEEDEAKLKANADLLQLIKKLNNVEEEDNWIGPYAVTKTIGEGATGIVKLAHHRERAEELYAIKIVHKKTIGEKPDEKKRVEREIRILRMVQHKYIMKLYDVMETKSHRYLILEYLQQGELYDILLKNGKIAPEPAFKYFFQVMMALAYLHRNQICHRDIKLENVILDHKGDAKLADFGMAVVVPPGARLMESVGSPHYACPQIIMGQRYDGYNADVWSLGVVLFVLLTGALPFNGDSSAVLFNNICNAKFRMPPELPDTAQDLIRSILKPEQDQRASLHDIQSSLWFQRRSARITPEMRRIWLTEFPDGVSV